MYPILSNVKVHLCDDMWCILMHLRRVCILNKYEIRKSSYVILFPSECEAFSPTVFSLRAVFAFPFAWTVPPLPLYLQGSGQHAWSGSGGHGGKPRYSNMSVPISEWHHSHWLPTWRDTACSMRSILKPFAGFIRTVSVRLSLFFCHLLLFICNRRCFCCMAIVFFLQRNSMKLSPKWDVMDAPRPWNSSTRLTIAARSSPTCCWAFLPWCPLWIPMECVGGCMW